MSATVGAFFDLNNPNMVVILCCQMSTTNIFNNQYVKFD